MIPSGAFQSPTSLDGVVPEFEQFALALNINSSLSIEAKKIMRNFDSGGGLTSLFKASATDDVGKKKRILLENMKKKFCPTLKTLLKDTKEFCENESSASKHIRDFGGSMKEGLYDRSASLSSTTDVLMAFSRILKDADRSESFLSSHFTRTIESLHDAMPNIVKHLEDILNARERLYRYMCSQRDQYDSTLERARKKRQKKGGIFGFGQKQQFDHAPELDDDVVAKRRLMEKAQKDYDVLTKYCESEFNAHHRRRESLLIFNMRELVAIQQMKMEVMLTGYSRILKALPADSEVWKFYGFDVAQKKSTAADSNAETFRSSQIISKARDTFEGREVATGDLPVAPETPTPSTVAASVDGDDGGSSKRKSIRRPPPAPRPASVRKSTKRPTPPKPSSRGDVLDVSAPSSSGGGKSPARRVRPVVAKSLAKSQSSRSAGDVRLSNTIPPKTTMPTTPLRKNKTSGDVLAKAKTLVQDNARSSSTTSVPLSRSTSRRSKPPKRPTPSAVDAAATGHSSKDITQENETVRRSSQKSNISAAISDALSASPKKSSSRRQSRKMKSTSPSASSQANFAQEAMAALKRRRSRKIPKSKSSTSSTSSIANAKAKAKSSTSSTSSTDNAKAKSSTSSMSSIDNAKSKPSPGVETISPPLPVPTTPSNRKISPPETITRPPTIKARKSKKSMADLKKDMGIDAGVSQAPPSSKAKPRRIDLSKVPSVVACSVAFLEEHGRKVEGVFRINGDLKLAEELLNEFKGRSGADVFDAFTAGSPSSQSNETARTVASLIKMYFRKLDKPIFPTTMYKNVLRKKKDAAALRILLQDRSLMPQSNYFALRAVIHLCSKIAESSAHNRMTPNALSICWAPSLLIAPASEEAYAAAMDAGQRNKAIETIIANFHEIFF